MRWTEKTIGRRVIGTELQNIPKLGDQLPKKKRTKKEKKKKRNREGIPDKKNQKVVTCQKLAEKSVSRR